MRELYHKNRSSCPLKSFVPRAGVRGAVMGSHWVWKGEGTTESDRILLQKGERESVARRERMSSWKESLLCSARFVRLVSRRRARGLYLHFPAARKRCHASLSPVLGRSFFPLCCRETTSFYKFTASFPLPSTYNSSFRFSYTSCAFIFL